MMRFHLAMSSEVALCSISSVKPLKRPRLGLGLLLSFLSCSGSFSSRSDASQPLGVLAENHIRTAEGSLPFRIEQLPPEPL
jgi:hypothetical protein